MYSYKDVSELAGYTARVAQLLETMADVRKGKFEKALVSSADTGEHAEGERFTGIVCLSFLPNTWLPSTIVTPNGDILVRSLSFYVKPGVSDPLTQFVVKHS